MDGRTGTVPPGRDTNPRCGLAVPAGARPAPARERRQSAVAWPLFSGLGPLGALPTAPRLARVFTALVLGSWQLRTMTEVSELITSELASNVVRAACGPAGQPCYDIDGRLPVLWLRLMTDLTLLRIEVWDDLPQAHGAPAARHPALEEESGRGLQLVEALSKNWGWEQLPGSQAKRVWALLTIS